MDDLRMEQDCNHVSWHIKACVRVCVIDQFQCIFNTMSVDITWDLTEKPITNPITIPSPFQSFISMKFNLLIATFD